MGTTHKAKKVSLYHHCHHNEFFCFVPINFDDCDRTRKALKKARAKLDEVEEAVKKAEEKLDKAREEYNRICSHNTLIVC